VGTGRGDEATRVRGQLVRALFRYICELLPFLFKFVLVILHTVNFFRGHELSWFDDIGHVLGHLNLWILN